MKERKLSHQMKEQRLVVIVDDQHDYKEDLTHALVAKGLATRLWGCPATCPKCAQAQPFCDTVKFIKRVRGEAGGRLVAIVLDANEHQNDEYSIKVLVPAIKRDVLLKSIPLVVYSAKYLENLGERALRGGADAFYGRFDTPPRKAAEIVLAQALK
jgi:hypothetical protein